MKILTRSRRFGTISALVFACTFGMLIWVKLRVVESVPRQAYADPKAPRGERTPAGFKQGKAPASTLLQAQDSSPQAQHAVAQQPQGPQLPGPDAEQPDADHRADGSHPQGD